MGWFILIVLSIFLILALFVVARLSLHIVIVNGGSMYPTLENGDQVLALRHWPAKWLRKGQIVVGVRTNSADTSTTSNGILYIKRVTGLPGDKLITHISELPEHSRSQQLWLHDNQGCRVWVIPSRHIFLQGDLALHSDDSRLWGPIPFRSLRGIVIMRLNRQRIL